METASKSTRTTTQPPPAASHHALRCRAKLAGRRGERQVDLHALQDSPCRVRRVARAQKTPLRGLAAHRDVLGHRQAGHDGEFLRHHHDAGAERVRYAVEIHGLAAHPDFAGVAADLVQGLDLRLVDQRRPHPQGVVPGFEDLRSSFRPVRSGLDGAAVVELQRRPVGAQVVGELGRRAEERRQFAERGACQGVAVACAEIEPAIARVGEVQRREKVLIVLVGLFLGARCVRAVGAKAL